PGVPRSSATAEPTVFRNPSPLAKQGVDESRDDQSPSCPTATVPPGKGLLPQESKHPVWLPSRGGSTNTHPSGSSCGREPNTGRSAAHKNGASDSPSSGFTRSNRFTKVDSTASITSSRSSAPGRHSRSIGHTPGHSIKRSVSASLDLPANGGCQLIRGEPLCVTRGTRR